MKANRILIEVLLFSRILIVTKKNLEINATKNVDLGWNAEYFKSFEFFLNLSTWTV